MRLRSLLAAGLLGLAACRPLPAPGPLLLAQAEQTAAPALAAADGRLAAAWVGADARGVHHDARILAPGGPEPALTLPLPPRAPFDQALLPAAGGAWHMLWLDQDERGAPRLYSALLSPALAVERGPLAVADMDAARFSAVSSAGAGWAAWVSGPPIAPAIMLTRIDAAGRPQPPLTLAATGDHPALAATPATLYAFWLADGLLQRMRLADGTPLDQVAIAQDVPRSPLDRLDRLLAGTDGRNGVVFWNLTRETGQTEVWWTHGPLDAPAWPAPAPFLSAAGAPVRYAAPLPTALSPLPVAYWAGEGILLADLEAGERSAERALSASLTLLAPPALAFDGDQLWVGWSAAQPDGAALLQALAAP